MLCMVLAILVTSQFSVSPKRGIPVSRTSQAEEEKDKQGQSDRIGHLLYIIIIGISFPVKQEKSL